MSKLNICFNGKKYSIDESAFADTIAGLEVTLSDLSKPKSSEGLAYTLNSDGVSYSVKKGTCTDTEIVIASEYEGLPVTNIGIQGFYSCSSLTSITIPDSVTDIGNAAFADCGNLVNITIPDSVTHCGFKAFAWCNSIKSITIPGSLTTLGESMFLECEGLESVSIYNGVTDIARDAFKGCPILKSVIIPSSVVNIGTMAFKQCEALQHFTFEGTVEQWNAITKDSSWNVLTPATYVQCSDGQVSLV